MNINALDKISCLLNNLIDHIFILFLGKHFSIYQKRDILSQRSMVLSDIFLYLFFVGSDIMLRFCSLRFISLPLTNLWTNLILRILVWYCREQYNIPFYQNKRRLTLLYTKYDNIHNKTIPSLKYNSVGKE